MKSFGELLTQYMARTGISDSELARHLGVSRQTIFRWKEGMTARPRVREDVLKCAERLRLTAAERDELLLAAGFAPERQVGGTPTQFVGMSAADDGGGRTEDDGLQVFPAAGGGEKPQPRRTTGDIQSLVVANTPTEITVLPARPKVRRGRGCLLAIIAALLVMVLFAAALALLPREREALIALLIPPTPTPVPTPTATPAPTPLPPDQAIVLARLNSRGGVAPPYDVTARLRQALEQEIETQNLVGARLADVADVVRNVEAAERLRARSGAEVMLWGNFSGNNARVDIGYGTRVPAGQRASVFPLLPRDQTVTLDMSAPNQLRTLALLTLLPLHLTRGQEARAQNALLEARALTPHSNELDAAMDFYEGYLLQNTAPRDLDAAVRSYNRNLNTTSLYEAHLNRGLAYLAHNEDAAAKSDFTTAQDIENARPEAWRAACWAFALEQQPQAALPLCDAAAARDATGWSLDSRAIVYAQLGRYADAANEFSNFLQWLDTQPHATRQLYADSRRAWIETLRAGRNPFDAETLNQLRFGD